MIRKIFFFVLLFGLFAMMAMARDAAPILPTVPLDPEVVLGFAMAWLGGIGVKGLTEIIKRFLKWEGALAVALSAAVSIACVVSYYMMLQLSFNVGYFIIYAALVFLQANGLYKANKPT
jgi:hypothetical protein